MRSVIGGKTWEGRCGFGTGEQRTSGNKKIRNWQTAVSISHTSALAKADFFHTCEYIHIQLANSNIMKTSDLSPKKISGSGKWGGSEILDWWDYRQNRISFNFVCSFLSARGSQSNSHWLPGTNLLTGIPRDTDKCPVGIWTETCKNSDVHFREFKELVNCAHAQERVIDMMWRMALARSLDWSIPVNLFSLLGFWVHLIVFGE